MIYINYQARTFIFTRTPTHTQADIAHFFSLTHFNLNHPLLPSPKHIDESTQLPVGFRDDKHIQFAMRFAILTHTPKHEPPQFIVFVGFRASHLPNQNKYSLTSSQSPPQLLTPTILRIITKYSPMSISITHTHMINKNTHSHSTKLSR